jgi:hypothetical protein
VRASRARSGAEMSRLNYTILLVLIASIVIVVDLLVALRTGRARGPSATVTRQHHPEAFKRHVRNDCVAMALGAFMILWALFSPFAFR